MLHRLTLEVSTCRQGHQHRGQASTMQVGRRSAAMLCNCSSTQIVPGALLEQGPTMTN